MTNGNHTSISISTGTMIRLLLLLFGVLLLWVLRDMALIIITSIVVASFVESAVPHLAKIGLGRVFGIAILYIISLIIFAGLFYLFAPLLITEIYNFSSSISSYVPGVSFLNYFQNESFSGAKDLVVGLSDNFSFKTLNDVSKAFIDNLSGGLFQTLAVAFGGIFNVFSIILVSFYLSIQEKGIENFLRLIFPLKYENYVVDLWQRSSMKIAFWVKSQMLLGLVVGVLIYLMLSLLGVEYALLLSIIAGIMEMIPYGTLISVIPALAISFFSGGFYLAFMVGMAYLIVHQFEVFLFAPVIIKKIVGLSPIVIILAALIGFELASIWGVVLSIPIAVILMELLSDIEKNKTLARTKHESR
jgi:predicted PurR-regulated permease PerM